jgi:hypothetical protein
MQPRFFHLGGRAHWFFRPGQTRLHRIEPARPFDESRNLKIPKPTLKHHCRKGGRVWKLWLELQGDFNPDDSIAETELELALTKLKLTNKKNPRKLLEEIASCEVKYGVPVSDGKKVAQLIRLGGKKYGTVITVTQMCKKSKKGTMTSLTLWTQMKSHC